VLEVGGSFAPLGGDDAVVVEEVVPPQLRDEITFS